MIYFINNNISTQRMQVKPLNCNLAQRAKFSMIEIKKDGAGNGFAFLF